MTDKIHHKFTIPDELGGLRLDQAVTRLLPDFSRTQIQDWIKSGELKVNGLAGKARNTVLGTEIITIEATPKVQPEWLAQNIKLDIVFEDESLLIINKPAGLVVHPGAGNPDQTLLNAILHYCPELKTLPRAGIVHRLDKDTSGLLVIGKNAAVVKDLIDQLKSKTVTRIYQAIVNGVMTSGGTVDAPIGRHPVQRKRMAVNDNGSPAVSHYRVLDRFRSHTRVKVQLETGRTHQIRVHMAYIKYPIFGDPVYGGRLQLPKGASPEFISVLRGFKRQALHACELGLIHPVTKKNMLWQVPLPEDMQNLLLELKKDAHENE
jgi:23S rRNA pseudouridine1911/1915/1917 synthase